MHNSRPIAVIALALLAGILLCNVAFAWGPSKENKVQRIDENILSMRQKAEDGLVDAQLVMARWYFDGSVLPKDHVEASRWYEMAAKQGNVEAQNALAAMYRDGDGIPKEPNKRHEWLVTAAKHGDACAYFELGRIFEAGDGVGANIDKAIRLYEEATKRGNAGAAYQLAQIYDTGSEVGWDEQKRDHYLNIAAGLGNSDATNMQEQIRRQLSQVSVSSVAVADEEAFETSSAEVVSVDSQATPADAGDAWGDLGVSDSASDEWGFFGDDSSSASDEWGFFGDDSSVMNPEPAPVYQQPQRWIQNQPQDEEAAIEYATRIGGLVGGAAGLEYQLNQMIEAAKQYQDVAEYSTDWNQQVRALQKAEALILSIPQIKSEYYNAENALISLRARDGQLFDDAMRVTIATPEVDTIIRAYCRRFIDE